MCVCVCVRVRACVCVCVCVYSLFHITTTHLKGIEVEYLKTVLAAKQLWSKAAATYPNAHQHGNCDVMAERMYCSMYFPKCVTHGP